LQETCKRMTVRGIVHLYSQNMSDAIQKGKTLFLKTYENKFLGNTNANLHVEDLMRSDTELFRAICSSDSQTQQGFKRMLTLYVTYNPCNYSSGGRNQACKHSKSCTKVLLDWNKQFLAPRDIYFRIKCANIYRAHWENKAMFASLTDAQIFEQRTDLAREGIVSLMQQQNIVVEAMTKTDWMFLLLQTKEDIVIPPAKWLARFHADGNIQQFLTKLISTSSTVENP
jgi:hypothetical protein